jgi:epoxyqueuosine reductase
MNLSDMVKQRALEIGFDLVGVAPLTAGMDLEFARAWVERGFGGEMHYLRNPKRDDPRRVLPSVRSVISVGLVYNAPLPYSVEESQKSKLDDQESNEETQKLAADGYEQGVGARKGGASSKPQERADPVSSFEFPVSNAPGPRAWISRYAWGRDYHEIMRAKLEELRTAIESLAPGVETRVYVDTGPVVERAFARFSGIGWMGKNTCLINEGKGSWFFIGVVLTSLDLEAGLPASDRCGSCTRCLEACPTGALVEPYVMDASRCISYLTIELKGSIPLQFRERIGANVFGCDICQDVCPWNGRPLSVVSNPWGECHQFSAVSHQPRRVATTELPEFQPIHVQISRPESLTRDSELQTPHWYSFFLFNPPIEWLASLTEEDFRRVFAHSPIKRVKYRAWLRNLCLVMGNSGDRRFLPWLERAGTHEDCVVREHARWAAGKLRLCG